MIILETRVTRLRTATQERILRGSRRFANLADGTRREEVHTSGVSASDMDTSIETHGSDETKPQVVRRTGNIGGAKSKRMAVALGCHFR